ncbi:hypothetical protein [Streptomyces sp. NBC_00385]|uniref:hypothetical protein n=1 Tax=Streptomyces sp. NBC_00385 TaxID=2975733 RepID=UPI002DDBD330|nr:hypothetical protein [Streptomyces sp. NBC_00385]WRZ09274.1 hypothetical protein OG959_00430 [Streptomyces sp. NBC_00385]
MSLTPAPHRIAVVGTVRRTAVAPPQLVMMDALSGDQIASLDLRGAAYTRRFTYPYLVTHRTDLHAALLSACQEHPSVGRVSAARSGGEAPPPAGRRPPPSARPNAAARASSSGPAHDPGETAQQQSGRREQEA